MKLVKMIRHDGKEADVHPEMVEDYRAGGFREVEAVKPKRRTKKAD